jgi:hypothetical protein
MAVCWSTGNTWQRVELTPSDFHLSEGPNDPLDPDGKLDMDAIANIGILDVNSTTGVGAGPHTFFLDDFELWTGTVSKRKDPSVIDDFSTPQLQWVTRGGAELMPENVFMQPGMRVNYEQKSGQGVLLNRFLTQADLRGKEWLAFDISSDKPADLAMSFEVHAPGKAQGKRYNANVEVEGGGKVHHREVLLSAFGENQPDQPPIKLDDLKAFTIVDISGQTLGHTGKNSLWIGNIHAVDGPKSQ